MMAYLNRWIRIVLAFLTMNLMSLNLSRAAEEVETQVPIPVAGQLVQTSRQDSGSVIRTFIEKKPTSTLKDVVDFANRRLNEDMGVPILFYSLTSSGKFHYIGAVKTEDGRYVPFPDPSSSNPCNKPAYFVSVTNITDKKLTISEKGKHIVLPMPKEFSPGLFKISSKEGKELKQIAGSIVGLPLQVSDDGQEAYFMMGLSQTPSSTLKNWWQTVTKGQKELEKQIPHLVFSISGNGTVKFVDDMKRYRPTMINTSFNRISLPNGTSGIAMAYENGLQVESRNMCSPARGKSP